MSEDALMVAARRIQRETGWDFVRSWNQAKAENPGLVQSTRTAEGPIQTIEATFRGEVKAIAPAGGTSYPINDPDAANERRDAADPKLGEPKARVDASSGERLLARAKVIQKSSGCSFSKAWLQAAAEHPELVNSTPSGVDNTLDGIKVTNVGPQTKAVDGFPDLGPA